MKRFFGLLLCVVVALFATFRMGAFIPCAQASTLCVDVSWPSSEDTDGDLYFRHIQAAIDAATDKDEIVVNPGTYHEQINFLGKSIRVRGTDPDDPVVVEGTVISGNPSLISETQLFGYMVTFDHGENHNSILEGISVVRGRSEETFPYASDQYSCIIPGGGIACYDSSPIIARCRILENYGGGIFCRNSSTAIIDCTVSDNRVHCQDHYSMGAGITAYCSSRGGVVDEYTISIIDCTVSGNSVIGCEDGLCLMDANSTIFLDPNFPLRYSPPCCPAGIGIHSDNINLRIQESIISENDVFGRLPDFHFSFSAIYFTSCTTNRHITITDCLINDNISKGIHCIGENHIVNNSTISNNDGTGIICSDGSITRCIISSNNGNGIDIYGNNMDITECTIDNNNYSAVISRGDSTISNCNIINNSHLSRCGAILCGMRQTETLTLINCLICNNSSVSDDGAGILDLGDYYDGADAPSINIINCTISDNSGGSGGIRHRNALNITNSIVWNNTPPQIATSGSGFSPTVVYSNIQGGWTGEGNIDVNPLFVDAVNPDPALRDYHLQEGSECIDVAATIIAPPRDLDGVLRPQDGNGDGIARADIGAYELPADSDGDGATDPEERGPSYPISAIDMNHNGIPDWNENRAVFSPAFDNEFNFGCTLPPDAPPEHFFRDFQTIDTPPDLQSLEWISFPGRFLRVTLGGVQPGQTGTIVLHVDAIHLGPEAVPVVICRARDGLNSIIPHGWDIPDAQMEKTEDTIRFTLEFQEGQRYDADGEEDAKIDLIIGFGVSHQTTWCQDNDGDGDGDPQYCVESFIPPKGYVQNGDDCDDNDINTHPGADERCDGKDNDCDGNLFEGEKDQNEDGIPDCRVLTDVTNLTAWPGDGEVILTWEPANQYISGYRIDAWYVEGPFGVYWMPEFLSPSRTWCIYKGLTNDIEYTFRVTVIDPWGESPGRQVPAIPKIDTDGDGMPDGFEVQYNVLDMQIADGEEDPDGDCLPNIDEYLCGTDPTNPDTDGDGLWDGKEVNEYETDPLTETDDSDNDGVFDADESGPDKDDPQHDGNGDKTPDKDQDSVASLPNPYGPSYCTVCASEGTFSHVRFQPVSGQIGENILVPYGLLGFKVNNVLSNSMQVDWNIFGNTHWNVSDWEPIYYKCDPTTNTSYPFMYDGEEGAVIEQITQESIKVILHLKDNGWGDSETAIHVIQDPGGLGFCRKRTWYKDADGDGYGNTAVTRYQCDRPGGFVLKAGDCNDSDCNTHPGAIEICDGKDNDCDGVTPFSETDPDGDGIMLCAGDNCPDMYNPGQEDSDGDGIGDDCDPDKDGDGVPNEADNCPELSNPGQADLDGDGAGDICDEDDDNDGILDATDNCPMVSNPGQGNNDGDGLGDVCDEDDDNDGILDASDNCPTNANTDQADKDKDGIGDACDADIDADCLLNEHDPCPCDADCDEDGLPDGTCSPGEDLDNDGIVDPGETDPTNPDTDGDGIYDGTEVGLTEPETDDTDLSAGFLIPDADPLTTTDPTNPDSDGDGVTDGEEDANKNGRLDEGETNSGVYTALIDIKPGSFPNCFNNDGQGVIPVAILGSATFDVSQVDSATVSLEGLAVKIVGKADKLLAHLEDVNDDGYPDLVVQIEDSDSVFEEGDTMARLTAALYNDMLIEGYDSICIVP